MGGGEANERLGKNKRQLVAAYVDVSHRCPTAIVAHFTNISLLGSELCFDLAVLHKPHQKPVHAKTSSRLTYGLACDSPRDLPGEAKCLISTNYQQGIPSIGE